MLSPSPQALHVKAGIERLFEELTAISNALAGWDGVHPPASHLADRIAEVETRLSRAEDRLRELRLDPNAACQAAR
jgi:hypothetical protein